MATIKGLIREVVKRGGAYAAAPKDTFTSYSIKSSVTTWEELGRFTAPGNGYVRVETKSSAANSTLVVLANDQPLGGVAYPYAGLKLAVSANVAKGQIVRANGNDLEECTMKFYASQGGGKSLYNQWVRRVLPCLSSNPSCASSGVSLRRSASTRDQKSASRSRSLRNHQSTFPHKTDGSYWRQTERECKQSFSPVTYKFSLSTILGLGVGARCRLSKATKSLSMSGGFPLQPRIKPSLCRHAASSNTSRWEVAA